MVVWKIEIRNRKWKIVIISQLKVIKIKELIRIYIKQ